MNRTVPLPSVDTHGLYGIGAVAIHAASRLMQRFITAEAIRKPRGTPCGRVAFTRGIDEQGTFLEMHQIESGQVTRRYLDHA